MAILLIINRYKYLILAVLLFGAGWYFNGLRWESKYADQLERARDTEQALQETVDAITKDHAAEMQRIDSKYRLAIDGLRNRPERLPESARSACAGSTGAELSRPDASAFERYAADAELQRQGAISCYAAYDKVKAEINGN
jgi:hypothetical protein